MSSAEVKTSRIVSVGELAPVLRLHHHTEQQSEELVTFLEDLLERAKSGDLRAIAVAYQHNGGDVGRAAILASGSAAHLHYALAWLQDHLLHFDD